MNFQTEAIIQYYGEFRTVIFLSSLTLGTFLFTMKSFIVTTMKTHVFDKAAYQQRILVRRRSGHEEEYYGPLRRFTLLILIAISCALMNALLQITVGYFENLWAVIVCVAATIVSWLLATYVLKKVSDNLLAALREAERETKERLEGDAPNESDGD